VIYGRQLPRVCLNVDTDLADVSTGCQYNNLYDICFGSVFLLCHESISYLLLFSAFCDFS